MHPPLDRGASQGGWGWGARPHAGLRNPQLTAHPGSSEPQLQNKEVRLVPS